MILSPGWYKLASRSTATEDVACYSTGNLLNVFISTGYYNDSSMAIQLCIALGYTDYAPQIINKTKTITCITKIREVYYKEENKTYLELYYASSQKNLIFTKIAPMSKLYNNEELVIDNGTPTKILYEVNFFDSNII